jgi:GNAT superfamily N-acetyltransferase
MVEVSTAVQRLDVALIHDFLSTRSHWARGIARERVERALANSLCFGAYESGRQVGLARVVTDRATFAWVADVFVVEAQRNRGIASMLMAAVAAHPDLQGLRRSALVTSTAPGLYARHGFAPLAAPGHWMERLAPAAYAAPS